MNELGNCTYGAPLTFDGNVPSSTDQWQFSSSTCVYSGFYNPTTTISSSTDVVIYGSMTAGEVLIAFFLFAIILLQLGSMIAQGLNKIHTKKKFMQYSGGDVEVRYDL